MLNRIEKFRDLIKRLEIDAILIKGKSNKKYIGALSGSGVKVLVTRNNTYEILDSRYVDEARKKTSGFRIIDHKGAYYNTLENIKNKESLQIVGVEGSQTLALEYMSLENIFDNVILLGNEIETLRAIKDKEEIERVRKACEVTDKIFSEVIKIIKVGVTEQEIAAEINYLAMKMGASAMSFDTIVASGYRSAMPHGRPTSKKIEYGDAIVIDFGIVLDNYQSDMTRTVFVGEVSEKLREIYNVVLKAHLKAIDAIRPDVLAKDVDKVARDYIKDMGYGEFFGHGLGHGMGMGDGEIPTLNPTSKDILKEGMIMSDEPGIYIPDLGGVRIEDDVAIIGGKGVPLNTTTKELIVL